MRSLLILSLLTMGLTTPVLAHSQIHEKQTFSLISQAQADEAPAPVVAPENGDPLVTLGNLMTNWKASTPLALGMMIVLLVMQGLKKLAPDFKYKRLAVSGLSVIYGVVLALTQGMGVVPAIVTVLITGGGAVALYEAWKGVSGQASA